MRYRNEKVSMGAFQGQEYERLVTTEEKVRSLLAVVSGEELDVARSPG